MGQRAVYKIDLAKIDGEGEFPCPCCKARISPDDESGLTYDVIDVKMRNDNTEERVVIVCKKCRSIIHLEGFEALRTLDEPNQESDDLDE